MRPLTSSRLALLLLCAEATWGGAAAAEPPRLTVVVVVDQLSQSDLERRLPRAQLGFRRLAQEGFRYLDARVESFPTVTASGHATAVTGAYPSAHGIVGNEWYDAAAGAVVQATEDARYPEVGAHPGRRGVAPTRLLAPTLGDVLKIAYPRARVVAIGGKSRTAVLLGGHAPDAVVWLASEAPELTTSAYYGTTLPSWAGAVNARLAQKLSADLSWDPAGPPVPAAAQKINPPEVAAYAQARPHVLPRDAPPPKKSELLFLHPLLDECLTDAAIEAIKVEPLGADAEPDLLALSFSGYDAIVHAFGPRSAEAEAAHDALDVQLGRLLDALDRAVGKGRYVVALTADHGGAPDPDALPARLSGGRVSAESYAAVSSACAKKLGADCLLGPFSSGGWNAAPKSRAGVLAMAGELAQVALAQPGVADFIPASELARMGGERGRLLQHGHFPGRSPDFVLLLQPFWLYSPAAVTGHGSQHLYDRQVPLVLFGAGVRRGTGAGAELVDVAPTLGFLSGALPLPSAEGHVLFEALEKGAARRR